MFSDPCDKEKDRQEEIERAWLQYPGGAHKGLHGGEPGTQEGEQRSFQGQHSYLQSLYWISEILGFL